MKEVRNYLDKLAVKLASHGFEDFAFDVWDAGTSIMRYASSNQVEEAEKRYYETKKVDDLVEYHNSGQMDRDIATMIKGGKSYKEIAERKFKQIQQDNPPYAHDQGAKQLAESLMRGVQRGAIRAASLIMSRMACYLKDLGYDNEAQILHSSFSKVASKGRNVGDKVENFQVISLEEMYENSTHKAEQKPILENIQIMVKTYESVLKLIKKFKKDYEKLIKVYLKQTGEEVDKKELEEYSTKMVELITYYDTAISNEFRSLAKAMV